MYWHPKTFRYSWFTCNWHKLITFLFRKMNDNIFFPVLFTLHFKNEICLFVSRVGWVPGLAPVLPFACKRVCICRNPQSREFPPHHYSGLGTRIRKWNIIGSYSFFMFPHPPPEICYSFTEYKILKYALLIFKLHRLNSDSDNTYRQKYSRPR